MQDHLTKKYITPTIDDDIIEDDFIRLGKEQRDHPEPIRNPPKPMPAIAAFERARREGHDEIGHQIKNGVQERRHDSGGIHPNDKYRVVPLEPGARARLIELLLNPPDSTIALAAVRPGRKKGALKLK